MINNKLNTKSYVRGNNPNLGQKMQQQKLGCNSIIAKSNGQVI